ncbi:hypothetical protein ES332_A08G038100v1 [Gossypium tomentosum]|uniref:Uncharacterized protein n=1 Tax=Gossypium tomentosum TaxID=34277 RepID=A0A5D2PE82_GOSTO|nr:hypothetical protein ES332_A08G038100v1 [Gossypium tomentosum]
MMFASSFNCLEPLESFKLLFADYSELINFCILLKPFGAVLKSFWAAQILVEHFSIICFLFHFFFIYILMVVYDSYMLKENSLLFLLFIVEEVAIIRPSFGN